MNHTDATGNQPLDVVCQDWATYASGTTSDTLGEISLVDCPAGGCLGFAFTLPSDFVGNKTYQREGRAAGPVLRGVRLDGRRARRTHRGHAADPGRPAVRRTATTDVRRLLRAGIVLDRGAVS